MRSVISALCLVSILAPPARGADRITQADLLRRVIDLDRLIVPAPAGERAGLFSSFDRRQMVIRDGRYVHWDANDDHGQFLRTTPDGWNVMAEIDGPGTITRIWCDKPAGSVRILLDGEAVIDAPLEDLFNGSIEPFGIPLSYILPSGAGANFCFPIGFAKTCRMLSRGFEGEYQIDYVSFPRGTIVERFQPKLGSDAQAALEEVVQAFKHGLSDRQLFGGRRAFPCGCQQDLKVGEKLTWDLKGAGTIRALRVSLTDKFEPRDLYTLHNLILRIYWDGREEPDVEVPVAAFFGTGYTRNLYNSLVMGTDLGTRMPGKFANESWFMYCYFPMPFRDGAHLEIENLASGRGKTLGLMLYLRVEKQPPPPNALRFKVHMRKEDPCQTFDFPVLETSGAGRIVGCVLNVDCPREEWWGDGDHKIWIDGEPFPSILGTSTAGYFANVPGLQPVRTPLHGATCVSTIGKNSVYRWHIADCVNFWQSVRFTIENWQEKQANDVYYNSVAYWYGEPGVSDSFESLSEETLALPPLRIRGAVEVEGNIVSANWGHVYKQKHTRGQELSGKRAATITTPEPVQIDIPWEEPGKYVLNLRVVTGRSFGTVEVSDAAGKPIGTAAYDRDSEGSYVVGEVTLERGQNRVIIQCTGSPAPILDCWIIKPLK